MFQTDFFSYLQLGLRHIADVQGYDHILFVTALAAMYEWHDWKRLLWLITAFTLGHSLTLALSTLNILSFSSELIEFCIPLTIFCTAWVNIATLRTESSTQSLSLSPLQERSKYAMALFFGFIHGMGFSTFLKSLLGKETNIVLPLFAFNLGLEAGQILIIMVILLLTMLMVKVARLRPRDWSLVLSGAALGIALTLMLKTFPS
ncbi:MAG: HupE/UreJ family protein [Candidatus Kapaibacterium sp.]|nr:MAG: HupE/UreJ family protein [Candidatus Kapabacteria bacterium]